MTEHDLQQFLDDYAGTIDGVARRYAGWNGVTADDIRSAVQAHIWKRLAYFKAKPATLKVAATQVATDLCIAEGRSQSSDRNAYDLREVVLFLRFYGIPEAGDTSMLSIKSGVSIRANVLRNAYLRLTATEQRYIRAKVNRQLNGELLTAADQARAREACRKLTFSVNTALDTQQPLLDVDRLEGWGQDEEAA
jgi:hypothetical protein